MTLRQILIFAFLCRSITGTHAQFTHIQSLTVADGLSQGLITRIYQDRQGFIWIGTLDGLNRYDGYTIRRFNEDPLSPFSLTGSTYITDICEDREGLLWIGTDEALYVFDPATERFYNISRQISNLPTNKVVRIATDQDGDILIHMPGPTDPTGLYHLEVPPRFSVQLRYTSNPLTGLAAQKVTVPADAVTPFSLESCLGDTLFLLRDHVGKGFRYSKSTYHFKPIDIRILDSAGTGIVWNGETGFFYRRKMEDGRDSLLDPMLFRSLFYLKDSSFITYSQQEEFLYKGRSDTPFRLWTVNESHPGNLSETGLTPLMKLPLSVNVLEKDRSGVLWIGTGGHGLRKMKLRDLAFRNYLPEYSLYNLREMPDGKIWLGKYHSNFMFDLATGQREPAPWPKLFKTVFYNVLQDRKENYWFVKVADTSTGTGSVYFWNKSYGNRFHEVAKIPYYKESIAEQILEDRHGNIWVAAHEGFLFKCSGEGRLLGTYNYSEVIRKGDPSLIANAFIEDHDGILWLGTSQGLVEITNYAANERPEFRLLQHDPNNANSLSWDRVMCLYQSPDMPRWIWIGTRGGGLNCYDKDTGLFKCYTQKDGLIDNVVYGILSDDEGNLWCSTNRGLSRFNPRNETFVNYYESDGLQANEFNTGAFVRNRQGQLIFGGINGLTVFDPHAVKMSELLHSVAVTSVKVRGNALLPAQKNSPLEFAPYFNQVLTLPFSDNNVTFEFAALDFANPSTNRYRYRMEGIDRDWIYSGTTHFANYASLPPGEYVFQVQAAIADGDWNPNSAKFRLVIQPPWYRHWLAYCLYLGVLAGLVWLYIHLREERIQEQHVLHMKERESDRLKELDTFKSRLFANITHEFRTPLTIILGLAERLRRSGKDEVTEKNATGIITQGNNLLDLVNQMLDLAKLETHSISLHPVQSNISAFIRTHARHFETLASHKNVRLTVETDKPDLTTDFDPQRFRQILNNLLSNAIRHTPGNGQVTLKFSHGQGTMKIIVSDSGEGIMPEDMPHIFDRFYQGSGRHQSEGTGGLGLALTRELVLLAGGSIEVESAPESGASFTVTLPVTRNAPMATAESIAGYPAYTPAVFSAETDPNEERPLLLVIEDNPVIMDYLRDCLKRDYQLIFAENGKKGVELALEHIPDLIISDVMMPEMDGLQVTETLRNDEKTSHIPIVLLTAKTQADERLDGLRHGASVYLTKPFLEEELLLVLNNQLALQRTWQQRYATLPGNGKMEQQPNTAMQSDAISREDAFMEKLYRIFEQHYADEAFHLEQLCRLVGMSSSQLHRKLGALTDQPAMQLLRTFRLHKARELLSARPDLQVSEIALMAGFSNAAHFSRLFSKTFGKPPSEARS